MKILVLFSVLIVVLSIFNACVKNEVPASDAEIENYDLIFSGLDSINFTIENNTFSFKTEEDYQMCLDYLETIETENYHSFEKFVGFKSLLNDSKYSGQTCPIEDEKFAVLLNPQMQIIVENYLFTLIHDNEKVKVQSIGKNKKLKSKEINTILEFSYEDDIFAILKGEKQLKSVAYSYCGQENDVHNHADLIHTKLDYNKYGIYNSLVVRIWTASGSDHQLDYMKIKSVNSPLDQHPSGITSRCFYKRRGKQNNTIYSKESSDEWQIRKTLWSNRRRLIGFRQDFEFWWKLNSNDPMSYDRIMIECHQY